MAVRRLLDTWPLLICLILDNCLRSSASEDPVMCSGKLWCESNQSNAIVESYFQYIPSSGVCIEVSSSCVPTKNCSFSSHNECTEVCSKDKKNMMIDCASTQYGCCNDGITVKSEGNNCPETAASDDADRDGRNNDSSWSIITSATCGTVLLIGLVAVVTLSTYAYHRRHRNRNRWYIHEVLQMYDGGDSSDSGADSSWDEIDPEHKNLFDHL